MRQQTAQLQFIVALAAFVALTASGRAAAQELAAAEEPRFGDAAAIDEVFADIEPDAPGCAVGVVVDQALSYAKGYGLANVDWGLPITPSSNFNLGSVSKQFTAAAVAHAAREGHLSLDDPIQKWLPEIPEYERTTRVRHLVHHTSGLRDYLALVNLSGWSWEDVHFDEEILDLITRQKNANFSTGDEFLYSNTGYFLLSVVIERATGQSLREYVHEHFLEPLGMERSRFNDDRREVIDERVVGYNVTDDGYRISHPWNLDKVGSGGMYSNIEDLAAWDRNYYSEEVGGAGFTEQLLEREVLNDGSTVPYAFGLEHGEYRGLSTISHGGAVFGFRSGLLRFPEQETTVLLLCNFSSSDPETRAQRVANVVLADHLEPEAEGATEVVLTREQLDAFAGTWRAPFGTAEIEREDEQLIFDSGIRRTPLTPVAENVLLLSATQGEMTFSSLVDGRFNAMSVRQGGQTFSAERIDLEAQAARDYSPLLGDYYSEELDVTYRIREVDGELMLELPPSRNGRLTPAGEDRFRAQIPRAETVRDLMIQIDRDAAHVRGFTIDAGRVRGISFERLQPMEDR